MVSLVITMTDTSGDKITSKLTYISSTATNSQLQTLASKIVATTTNTLVGISRIEETDITSAE